MNCFISKNSKRGALSSLMLCMTLPSSAAITVQPAFAFQNEPVVEETSEGKEQSGLVMFGQPVSEKQVEPEVEEQKERDEKQVEMAPTQFGVRFTPEIAQAISSKMVQGMKTRYEMNDEQIGNVQNILNQQLMKLAQQNAETGRDMIELMMAEMIKNDGRFTAEAGIEFAKKSKKILPELQKFFTETSGKIGKQMGIKQRLKFTGDMAAATAGLVVFENRMKRWEEGKLGDFANPFYDPADNNPELATSQPVDPNEKPEVRRVRQSVERSLEWEINIDVRWEEYVKKAIEFYNLDEPQSASARSILKECQDRAAKIKTLDWRNSLKQIRMAQRMSWQVDPKYNDGPWEFQQEKTFEDMMKPLHGLEEELKKRIEGLPTTKQKSIAMDELRRKFEEKGMKITRS